MRGVSSLPVWRQFRHSYVLVQGPWYPHLAISSLGECERWVENVEMKGGER